MLSSVNSVTVDITVVADDLEGPAGAKLELSGSSTYEVAPEADRYQKYGLVSPEGRLRVPPPDYC